MKSRNANSVELQMKIYMFGIGGGGQIVERWNLLPIIQGFIVSDKTDNMLQDYMGKKIYTPDEVVNMDYDAIIVASVFVENIYNECKAKGFDMSKVLFVYRGGAAREENFNYQLAVDTLGQEKADLIRNSWHVIDATNLWYYDDPKKYNYRNIGMFGTDYVRMRTFELICREINARKLPGSVAELGVFRGAFTYFLNRELPGRKCYLFDTFGGFDDEEAKNEVSRGSLSKAEIATFRNTSIDIVMKQLAYPDTVEIRKGYFPDSLNGLEDNFAFVSIDVDLEESIYNGLKYFYPRLNSGGYIMVHDYNSPLFGVRRAVDRFESECGFYLCRVPLCDNSGTLVITK